MVELLFVHDGEIGVTDYGKEQCVFGGVCTFSYAQM